MAHAYPAHERTARRLEILRLAQCCMLTSQDQLPQPPKNEGILHGGLCRRLSLESGGWVEIENYRQRLIYEA